MANSCGAGDLANTLLPSLVGGKNFDIPDIDFNTPDYQIPDKDLSDPIYSKVKSLTLSELTERTVDGNGVFDALMTSAKSHLREEYDASRITGDQYAKAYIELTATCLGTATQFLLGKDQAFWQAVIAQQQAQRAVIETITARVGLETSKAQYAMAAIQAMGAEAEYGLTKLRISSEDANYCNLLAQKDQIIAQTAGIVAQTDQTTYQTAQILPVQKLSLQEQAEAARAQTHDTRTDGVLVAGSIGKQKELHAQQIISFQRDAEVKAAKLFTDAWITQKTIDEGLIAPPGFQNASVDTILSNIKIKNGLN